MLKTEGLTKVFGKRTVVNRVDIMINPGEVVGLLGPNGAGKTTTFNMIVGLLLPEEGHILLDGVDITTLPMFKRARMGISFLCQESSVFRKMTVLDNLVAIYEIHGVKTFEAKQLGMKMLEEFNLSKLKDQKAYTLSGGERRRVEIARAMISKPKYLLLDEPFTGIDPIARAELQEIIISLKNKGIGILVSDHNVRETLEITDRAYLIYESKILFSGDAQTLINDPKAREVYLGWKFKI